MDFFSRLIEAFFSWSEIAWIRWIRDLHTFIGRPYFFNKMTMVRVEGGQEAKIILEYNDLMVERVGEIGYDITVPDQAIRMFAVSCIASDEFGLDDEQ